ncbi:MAG: hypothetical protein ACI38A_10505 [Candidatus Ornithomonoglobus sp.]
MPNNLQNTALGVPYKRKCGNTVFIISSFGNPNTTKTADDLILRMLENQVKECECK